MANYQKNIRLLKESIYSILSSDSTLESYLTGSGKIYHRQPPQEPTYPCLIYSIVSDFDSPYNETISNGEITKTNFRISIFSNESTTEQIDNIEAQVKTLLHGQRTLDSTKIICYSCYRDSMIEPIMDEKLKVWVSQSRYIVTWATRAIPDEDEDTEPTM